MMNLYLCLIPGKHFVSVDEYVCHVLSRKQKSMQPNMLPLFGLAVRKFRTKLNAHVLESAPLRCLKPSISVAFFNRSDILKCLL